LKILEEMPTCRVSVEKREDLQARNISGVQKSLPFHLIEKWRNLVRKGRRRGGEGEGRG